MTGLPKYTLLGFKTYGWTIVVAGRGLAKGQLLCLCAMRELFSKVMNADCIEYFHNLIIQLIDWQQGNLSHLQMIL